MIMLWHGRFNKIADNGTRFVMAGMFVLRSGFWFCAEGVCVVAWAIQ